MSLESEKSNNIILLDKTIDVYTEDCDDDQIKMNLNNYYFCENPICNNECPISKGRAICIKSNIPNFNNVNLNECKCLSGWKGKKCDSKDIVIIK